MKIAPIWHEMGRYPQHFDPVLLHTGQHYDYEMSKVFFEDLGLPEPDIYLGVGSGTHAQQTARVMATIEKVLSETQPDLVIVVGDVNSTLACTLVAAKIRYPGSAHLRRPSIAHIEAGLRSFDRRMPEEINRLVADTLSDYLFTTCEDADENLRHEGVPQGKIFFVGNVMVDALLNQKEKAKESKILQVLGLRADYALLTLHRPENVDDRGTMSRILDALAQVGEHIKIVFPIHPRTRKRLTEFGLLNGLSGYQPAAFRSPDQGLLLIDPVGYTDFLRLMEEARLVLTDSGGVQEETTFLGIPCLTLRRNTERPITITQGTNVLVGTDPERIVNESLKILRGEGKTGSVPRLWDGKAARRIINVLLEVL